MPTLGKMLSYPEWRNSAELVFETVGWNKGAIHVRVVSTGRVLCGLSSGLVESQMEMPVNRDALPPMHIGCLGRVPR